jgi:hypothetical protein
MVRVKLESMESIELLYGALWVAPPCYQDGGHSAPPRSLLACGADRLRRRSTDDRAALNRAPFGVTVLRGVHSGACSDLMQTPPRSKEPSRGQEGSRGDKERTHYREDEARREVGIRMRMCAFVRSERQLWASFRAGTSSKQKSARFCPLREKKVWKAFPPFWDRIRGK